MKKLVAIFLMMFTISFVNAQFIGGFHQADPDAWINKEPYFACKNVYTYNGWGQNLQNIYIVINETDVYFYPHVWEYGTYITIGKESGINFSSGDVLSLYLGDKCIGTWTYRPSYALPDIRIRGGKTAGKVLKATWKYIKNIK